jgi:hypothetical protein
MLLIILVSLSVCEDEEQEEESLSSSLPLPTLSEAKSASEIIVRFFEGCDTTVPSDIAMSTTIMKRLYDMSVVSQKQTVITDFFKKV